MSEEQPRNSENHGNKVAPNELAQRFSPAIRETRKRLGEIEEILKSQQSFYFRLGSTEISAGDKPLDPDNLPTQVHLRTRTGKNYVSVQRRQGEELLETSPVTPDGKGGTQTRLRYFVESSLVRDGEIGLLIQADKIHPVKNYQIETTEFDNPYAVLDIYGVLESGYGFQPDEYKIASARIVLFEKKKGKIYQLGHNGENGDTQYVNNNNELPTVTVCTPDQEGQYTIMEHTPTCSEGDPNILEAVKYMENTHSRLYILIPRPIQQEKKDIFIGQGQMQRG